MSNEPTEPNEDGVASKSRSPIVPMSPQSGALVGTTVGTMLGAIVFLIGYLVSVGDRTSYGIVIFLLVPIASGFTIFTVVKRRDAALTCLFSSLIISLILLIGTGFEGYICCLMALPLLLIGMAFGAFLSAVTLKSSSTKNHGNRSKTMLLLIGCPCLIAAADRVERPFRTHPRQETITSEIFAATTAENAWDALVRLNVIEGEKPFLLRIGMPVPLRCELEASQVGAKRTCHFDQGVISQSVRSWEAPYRMVFNVTESTLPGRRWLSFVDAEYEIVPQKDGVKIIRRSTISSRLYPRWYWRPFEQWGVESEHDYVLSNVQMEIARTVAE